MIVHLGLDFNNLKISRVNALTFLNNSLVFLSHFLLHFFPQFFLSLIFSPNFLFLLWHFTLFSIYHHVVLMGRNEQIIYVWFSWIFLYVIYMREIFYHIISCEGRNYSFATQFIYSIHICTYIFWFFSKCTRWILFKVTFTC